MFTLIETSRDLISVANTGPSGLIKADGQIMVLIESFQQKIQVVELNLNKQKTGYVIWHETPLIILLSISFYGAFVIKR